MAVGKGIQIVVGTDYSDRDLKRAQRDLDRLKREAAKSQTGMQRLSSTLRGRLGPSLGFAAAAAGAFALKIGVDAVKAAAAEEQAVTRLATALDNAGQSMALDGVERFIDSMARATGIADDQLRPAMITLVNATKDANEAQGLLALAMDISAGSGRDLSSVTMALAKAANGQVTALRRLGVPLSDAAVKSKDLNAITAELQQTFAGQAAKAASTFQGRLNRLGVAASELQEAFGKGLIEGLTSSSTGVDDMAQTIQDLEPLLTGMGEGIGSLIAGLGDIVYVVQEVADTLGIGADATQEYTKAQELSDTVTRAFTGDIFALFQVIGMATDAHKTLSAEAQHASVKHADYRDAVVRVKDAARDSVTHIDAMGNEITQSGDDAEDAAEKFDLFAAAINKTEQVVAFRQAIDKVGDAFKKANTPVNIFNEKGQENFDTLKGLIERTASFAETQSTLAGRASIASQGLSELETALGNAKMDSATRALLLEPFQALIDDLAEAGVDVTNLQLKLDALKSKTITITTEYRFTGESKAALYEADGGMIAGGGFGVTRGSDTVPAMLTPGEFVVRKAAVQKFGAGLFSQLNRGINPLAGMSTSSGSSGGLSIGSITVQSAPGEAAETSIPRALRRMAFLAGI